MCNLISHMAQANQCAPIIGARSDFSLFGAWNRIHKVQICRYTVFIMEHIRARRVQALVFI